QAGATTIVQKVGAGVSPTGVPATTTNFTLTAGTTVTLANAGNRFEGPIAFTGPAGFNTINLKNDSLLPQFPTMPNTITTLTLNYGNAPIILPNITLANFPVLAALTVTALGVFQQTGTTIVLPGGSQAIFTALAHPIILDQANDFANLAV